MTYETPEQKRAELVKFRLEELKPFLELVGRNTNNKLMRDLRNQLAHCKAHFAPYGTVFMEEPLAMSQTNEELTSHIGQCMSEDRRGHRKVYVRVGDKWKILYHIYTLEQWEQLFHQFREELSDAGELIPLPRTVMGCPVCGDFPSDDSGMGQVVCDHVTKGIEQAYIRDEFGDIVSRVTFNL